MSVWERIDAHGDAYPLKQAEDRKAKQKYGALMDTVKVRRNWNPDRRENIDEEPAFLALGADRRDGTQIRLVAKHWGDLHGPDGVCTCCPRAVARAS